MTEFPLDIVTPDGKIFSGRAESLRLRSIEGDLCIRARHTDYVTALGMGPAEVITAGNKHIAACMGGMVSVLGGRITLTATTFEWAEDIDTARSHASEERAREKLGHGDLTDTELAMAEAILGTGVTAAGQGGGRSGVVGRAEGAAGQQRAARVRQPRHGPHAGGLQRLGPGHVRQDGGQALGQHGLSGAG